jgi:hypothetical protein
MCSFTGPRSYSNAGGRSHREADEVAPLRKGKVSILLEEIKSRICTWTSLNPFATMATINSLRHVHAYAGDILGANAKGGSEEIVV